MLDIIYVIIFLTHPHSILLFSMKLHFGMYLRINQLNTRLLTLHNLFLLLLLLLLLSFLLLFLFRLYDLLSSLDFLSVLLILYLSYYVITFLDFGFWLDFDLLLLF